MSGWMGECVYVYTDKCSMITLMTLIAGSNQLPRQSQQHKSAFIRKTMTRNTNIIFMFLFKFIISNNFSSSYNMVHVHNMVLWLVAFTVIMGWIVT